MSSDSERVAVNTDEVWPEDAETDEGVVINWFTSEGSHVEEGNDICELQVEKVDIDVPAPVTGTVDEIALNEDEEFKRGDTLAWIRPD